MGEGTPPPSCFFMLFPLAAFLAFHLLRFLLLIARKNNFKRKGRLVTISAQSLRETVLNYGTLHETVLAIL